jgi:hypothetical protein
MEAGFVPDWEKFTFSRLAHPIVPIQKYPERV